MGSLSTWPRFRLSIGASMRPPAPSNGVRQSPMGILRKQPVPRARRVPLGKLSHAIHFGHRSCHRVAAAGGKIGGFSAHGGAQMKLKLLAIEGQTIAADIRDASRVNARCLAAIHENCHGRLWMLPGASRQERATKNEGRYGLA